MLSISSQVKSFTWNNMKEGSNNFFLQKMKSWFENCYPNLINIGCMTLIVA